MWPWLRNEHFKNFFVLTDRQKFLCKLCLFTFVGHVLVLILGTCSYFGFNEHERFVISSQHGNTVYVLTPLQKQVKSSVKQRAGSLVKSSKVIDYGTYEQLKKQQKKQTAKNTVVAQPVKAKKTSKALTSSLAALKEVNQSAQKKAQKAQITISEVKVVKNVEPEKKVTSAVIKEIDIVKDEKPIIPEPIVSVKEERISEPLKQEVVAQKENCVIDQVEPQKNVAELSSKEKAAVESSQNLDKINQEVLAQDDIDIDNVTFIGYEQLDSLAVQNKIQQVIQQNFKSPIGIKKDVSCELTVLVGDSGKSKKVTIIRPSGILVYDTSARAMLYKIEFPKEVWNKTITIILGQ